MGGQRARGLPALYLLPHLRRASDLADRHYADPLHLEELAAAAGVSKYHFLRAFAAVYGRTRPCTWPSGASNAPRTCCARPI